MSRMSLSLNLKMKIENWRRGRGEWEEENGKRRMGRGRGRRRRRRREPKLTISSNPPTTNPIIISGPSGVGKGTLYSRLLANHPSLFTTSISHTTRAPRPGETRDVDYYFVPMEEFEAMIAKGDFVEHAKFGGNRYGTSRKMIEEKRKEGKIVVLDIEMEGVKQIHSLNPPFPARYIFISPPSTADMSAYQVLEKRLRGRGTEKEESIQKRLAQAKLELEYSKTEGVHDKIIVNDDLEVAYKELEEYILELGFRGHGILLVEDTG